MKIIQIMASTELSCWAETPGVIESGKPDLFGLSDEGHLYKWGRKKLGEEPPKEGEVDDETGEPVTKPHMIFGDGWILMEDEIAAYEKGNH